METARPGLAAGEGILQFPSALGLEDKGEVADENADVNAGGGVHAHEAELVLSS